MGGLVVFVYIKWLYIVWIAEVFFRKNRSKYFFAGCHVVEQGSNDRKIQDEFIKLCRFPWNLAPGGDAFRIDEHELLKQVRAVTACHCRKRCGCSGGNDVGSMADL